MKRWPMLLPLALIATAIALAFFLAYGVSPGWATTRSGLGIIVWSRRLQWPLIVFSLLPCLLLLGLVITGKHRAWWLIGLAPVLALFVHRFLLNPINRYSIASEPTFVSAADAKFVGAEDYVVGVIFNGEAYAYPFACLYRAPIVVQSEREKRLLLMWSVRANVATALVVAREMKARDLDIVSDPADALLLYNNRTGQFIASVTGKTVAGEHPTNVEAILPIVKTTWRDWKSTWPETKVMSPWGGRSSTATRPLTSTRKDAPEVTLIGQSIAITDDVTVKPLNIAAGDYAYLVFRDPSTGRVRAFDRHVDTDLSPRFDLCHDRKRKGVAFIDADTGAGWSMEGHYVDGHPEFKGKRLMPVEVQEDVNPQAIEFWLPKVKRPQPTTRQGLG